MATLRSDLVSLWSLSQALVIPFQPNLVALLVESDCELVKEPRSADDYWNAIVGSDLNRDAYQVVCFMAPAPTDLKVYV